MASSCENVKWIPGTNFLVDGFMFKCDKCKHYFLTHCHSDHTVGITKTFKAGTIYCTEVSARLLIQDKGLNREFIQPIPLNKSFKIQGVQITFMDANHCPGSCIILFEVPDGETVRNILHTGDFRFQSYMTEYAALKGKQIDVLYLDNTYAFPRYNFPPQIDAIQSIAQVMLQELRLNPRTKFLVNSYRIGKERAYLGAAQIAGLQVWVSAEKRRLLNMLDLPQNMRKVLSDNPQTAEVHVSGFGFNDQTWKKQGFQLIGIRATGWELRKENQLQARQWKGMKVYGIPYSEHSSWSELRLCIELLKPKKIVPTVTTKNPDKIVAQFADLMDHSNDSTKMDPFVKRQHDESNQSEVIKNGVNQISKKRKVGDEFFESRESNNSKVIDLTVDDDPVVMKGATKQIITKQQRQQKRNTKETKQTRSKTKIRGVQEDQTSILDFIKRVQ